LPLQFPFLQQYRFAHSRRGYDQAALPTPESGASKSTARARSTILLCRFQHVIRVSPGTGGVSFEIGFFLAPL